MKYDISIEIKGVVINIERSDGKILTVTIDRFFAKEVEDFLAYRDTSGTGL